MNASLRIFVLIINSIKKTSLVTYLSYIDPEDKCEQIIIKDNRNVLGMTKITPFYIQQSKRHLPKINWA